MKNCCCVLPLKSTKGIEIKERDMYTMIIACYIFTYLACILLRPVLTALGIKGKCSQ